VAIVVLFVMVMASPQIKFPLRIVHHSSSSQSQVRKAKVKLIAAGGTGKAAVYGLLKLTETSHGVYIRGKILGLEAGNHGFHVHEIGDTGNSCDNAGPHFNPEHVCSL
jgi:Cu/Zn superoxide dismutase